MTRSPEPDLPRVSVVMPVYNSERYIEEALRSILDQDYRDFELLLVDDGSTDRSREIAEAHAARDARIRILGHERNRGVSAANNTGIAAARGEYIARMDSDDKAMPGRLRRQVAALDSDPAIVLVTCDFLMVDDASGLPIRTVRIHEPPEVISWLLLFGNGIGGHGQVMLRGSVVRELGGYSNRFEASEDYELWTRLVERGRFAALGFVGMHYRVHGNAVSLQKRSTQIESSKHVSRSALQRHLGRPLAEAEINASAHLWQGLLQPRAGAAADRIVREAYESFAAPSPRVRRRMRVTVGRRFFMTAMLLAARGRLFDAADHVLRGLAWQPLGGFEAIRVLGELTRFAVLRRLARRSQSDTSGAVRRFLHRGPF
jgi:GT2 family glycosyltransferase